MHVCFFWLLMCIMCLYVHGNTFSNTCTHVYEIERIPWNVFWFLMLCGGGSTHYVRGYFHCVPLLRPEEREFSPLPNKGTVHRQWLPSTGILTWPVWEVVNLLLHYVWRPFSSGFFFSLQTVQLEGFNHVGEILASRNHIFHRNDSIVLPHLSFVASAGHSALEEAEGPADFVLFRLDLRRDYVFVPLLILDPVSVWTFQATDITSMFPIILGLWKTAAFKPNMHTINKTYYLTTFNILRRAG